MLPRLVATVLLLVGCPDQTLTSFNAEPEAEILSPVAGDAVMEGATVELRGQVSDADDAAGELSAAWYAGDTELCAPSPPHDDGLTACAWTADLSGNSVRLEVIDPGGAAGKATVTLAVSPNTPPTVEILAPVETARYYSGSLVSFDALVSDVEDAAAALSVAWTSADLGDLGLPTSVDADGHARGAVALPEGQHYVELTATDSFGKIGVDTVVIAVGPPNGAPSCSILTPLDGESSREGESVLLSGTASDPDVSPEILTAAWSSDRDGLLSIGTPSSEGAVTFAADALSPGTHTLTLTITDDAAATCVASVVHTVLGVPAVAILEPADGDVAIEGSATSFVAEVSDPEDPPDALVLSWESDLDGVFGGDPADGAGRAAFTWDGLSAGLHTVTLTATDTDGLWTSASVTHLVDAVPSAPVVALSPDPAATDDDLVASLTTASTDPDGDAVTYAYEWYVGGVLSAASSTSTLPASATSRGESWSVVVIPSDPYAEGPSGSAELVIADTAPEVTDVEISPSAPETDDTLTATVSSSDLDGDSVSLSYAWKVDGDVVGTGAALPGSAFSKGETVIVAVTPSDGELEGATVLSDGVMVVNSAPGAATVDLLPDEPAEGVDDLVCTVSASDADGDTLEWTFSWTVDGVAWTEETATTTHDDDTVPGEATEEGEVWTCTASADDGEASGSSATDSVTVEGCPYGGAAACAGSSCDDILASGHSSGDGTYFVDPDGSGGIEVYCEMSTDGGGWTLVAVASDDGADTWTYTRRRYWDVDTTTFGSLSSLDHDYKSAVLHTLPMTDVMLFHAPSGTWASYDAVGDGSGALASVISGYGDEYCWKSSDGYPMSAGGLVATGGLCTTNLTFNAADHDGGGGSCSCSNCTEDTYGPGYSTDNGDGCPFDDPGTLGSLGPDASSTAESAALGFGAALGLNTGAAGGAENYMRVFVR